MPPASTVLLVPSSVSSFDAMNAISLSPCRREREPCSGRGWLREAEVGSADAGIGGQLAGGAADHQVPRLQHVGARGQDQSASRVLLDEQDGHPFGVEARDDVEDLAGETWGQAQRGLVEEKQARPDHEGARYREHLLLAARERARELARSLTEPGKESEG